MASVEEDPDLALSADALSALQGFLSDRGVEVSETPGAIRDGIAGLLAAGAIGTAYEDSSDEEGGEDGESSARKAPKIAFDRYVRKDADHCASLAQPRVLHLDGERPARAPLHRAVHLRERRRRERPRLEALEGVLQPRARLRLDERGHVGER